jgi:general transcription factor 3C polypeptide 3 (transcription factor C subunit 4)
MKLSDVAVNNPGNLRWNPLIKRYALKGGSTKDEGEGEDEEEEDGGNGDPSAVNISSNEASDSKTAATPPLPTKENPLIVTIYGQICIAAKSYQSAICESSSLFVFSITYLQRQFICCMHTITALMIQ